MSKLENIKTAIVCDWIKDMGGGEKVLVDILNLFPNADIFTSVFWQKGNPLFEGRKITTSFIQKIPFFNKRHKMALFLRPRAFESFDLGEYDLVISLSSAESKGIITKPETLHICYCHTPTRYFWSHYKEYFKRLEFGILNPVAIFMMNLIIHNLRLWDFAAAQRVDYFIANSDNTKRRIRKYYRRDSVVMTPSVDIDSFPFSEEKKDYYFYVGRMVPYKKFDLLVDTFNENGKKIILSTATDNELYRKLKSISKPNIEWIFGLDNDERNKYMSEAKAVFFPSEEDFGIVPIEAMATGTPVIAYKKGGALETVRENHKLMPSTGVFFEQQTVESLNLAIDKFEKMVFEPKKLREYAYNFDVSIFRKDLMEFIESKI
ncbi:MAG: glycosyltransferase [Candidatus Gracilibacteria bacterium]|nr:glycosyltransferase [Candidatus Gracilibacteria bacterium]